MKTYIIGLAAMIALAQCQVVIARGFGGGGGGGGAHFGGGGGAHFAGGGGEHFGGAPAFRESNFRSSDFRGSDFRGGGGFDRGNFGGGEARADAFNNDAFRGDHPDAFNNDAARAATNRDALVHNYNWPSSPHLSQEALAGDTGFSRIAGITNAWRPTGNSTYHYAPSQMAQDAHSVRSNFRYNNMFSRGWWGDRHGWWNSGWGYGWPYAYSDWGMLAPFWGLSYSDIPYSYDYGDDITYDNGDVYYGTQDEEPASTYYEQSQTLAESCDDTANDAPNQSDWKSMGVFSLVQGQQQDPSSVFELATDKNGNIRGNYYNMLTDAVQPVTGKVDKKIMRASWIVGDNKEVVYDTGVGNLLKDQSPILVHFAKDRTEQWTLVRLPSTPPNSKSVT